MNVSIRRQGITIKTIAVKGDRARIGSGNDCEIQLNDPFLAPMVAEIVKRDSEWHLVDSGTSLEGVTRGGVRIIDEPLTPDQSYVVGAFELVTDANATRRTASGSRAQEQIPMTMMQADLMNLPGTVVEVPMPVGGAKGTHARNAPASDRIVFAPLASGSTAAPQPAPAVRGKEVQGRRILLTVLAALATVVITMAILVTTSRKTAPAKRRADVPVTSSTAPAPVTATVTPAADGNDLARKLEIEKAFTAWESQIAKDPAGSSELRRKVSDGAFELARAYAAANDTVNASRYFEKVVRHGTPDSEKVRYARARLQPR